ncbi:hypothetical protein ACFVIM_27745 [Streptomyces sp. NPDC057638]|uniref:hypothetical protein n=1 Tax=Streptomyces sp. NPDC057638 TaxID=3346190 RepID=UPI003686FE97
MVAGLTAASIATVGVLAYQASASAPDREGAAAKPAASAPAKAPQKPRDPLALPVPSDTGVRVVYRLSGQRVWLVSGRDRVLRTFTVTPSTVIPAPGTYQVMSRSGRGTGGDGAAIEHVVRFHQMGRTVIGFSAAVDGTVARPEPGRKTGGVRMTRADGDAMWRFATIDTKVVVVP